jgi:hypothetical protein
MTLLAIFALLLALLPAVMTFVNLAVFRTPPLPAIPPRIAILIPARDEEEGIGACLDAALASTGADVEVVVLDDASTDRTADIVRERTSHDGRLRLAEAPPLPAGWNGKQHACHVLAGLTDCPVLLFVDADVRLAPEGAARLAEGMRLAEADLASGVPRQITGSVLERAVIPMINGLLLGYLPMRLMRTDPRPSLAAGCGQMMMVRREAYLAAGGHEAIRTSLHDGLKLPRLFREHRLRTELVDGTRLAQCRMYSNAPALIGGLLKNATEGMARPAALPVWTLLLLGGQVLPFVLLLVSLAVGNVAAFVLSAIACSALLAAWIAQARQAGEAAFSVLLRPFGVVLLLGIQWAALVRQKLGIRTQWRGRAYQAQS